VVLRARGQPARWGNCIAKRLWRHLAQSINRSKPLPRGILSVIEMCRQLTIRDQVAQLRQYWRTRFIA